MMLITKDLACITDQHQIELIKQTEKRENYGKMLMLECFKEISVHVLSCIYVCSGWSMLRCQCCSGLLSFNFFNFIHFDLYAGFGTLLIQPLYSKDWFIQQLINFIFRASVVYFQWELLCGYVKDSLIL